MATIKTKNRLVMDGKKVYFLGARFENGKVVDDTEWYMKFQIEDGFLTVCNYEGIPVVLGQTSESADVLKRMSEVFC